MNSFLNNNPKKRVVATLFLYLLIFSLGCDFESPQKWETPSWYLPLTIPLINTVYSFEGIVDSSMIFSDSLTNVIQVVFGSSIPMEGGDPLGIPDSIFNINMSTVVIDETDIGMEGIAIEVAGGISIPINIPIPAGDLFNFYFPCFPESKFGTVQDLLTSSASLMNGTLEMPFSFESHESFTIKRLIVTEGSYEMSVSNNFSLPINVIFDLTNSDSTLYSVNFDKIMPYSTETNNVQITDDDSAELYISEAIKYNVNITMLNEEKDCQTTIFEDGWTVQEQAESLIIDFTAAFDKIGSVVADVNIEAPSTDPIMIGIPSMAGISITKAKFAESTSEYPNQFQFNITNGFIDTLYIKMNFNNIFDHAIYEGVDYLTSTLVDSMTIEPGQTLIEIIDISDKFLAYGVNSEQPVDSIEITYVVHIPSKEYTIDVVDGSINIGMPSINSIEVTNLRLEYIAAVTDSLKFPEISSPPIEGIPDGFSGFEFYDIMMEIDFFNEIGVPVGLKMKLLGSKADSTETIAVDINIDIGAPYKDNYGCNFATTGDIARTLIQLNKNGQTTEYYCSPDSKEPSCVCPANILPCNCLCICPSENCCNQEEVDEQSNIVDLMNFAPEHIYVGGEVIINGEGILTPGSQIWGTFTIVAPLAFIFEKPINIIPAESTPMSPMDPSTSQQIDSALVEAALNVTITNSSPLGGSLSLLISDSTIFPLFLDSLTTGSWENQLYNFNTTIWDTLGIAIDSISFTPIDPSDAKSKALEVRFYKNNILQFFVGRMFELEFPRADSIEYHSGFANPEFPNIHTSSMVIDTTRMAWVITEESRYTIAMITFDKSPIQSGTGEFIPLTFQITNTIGVQAYLTLTLDTGGLGREKSSNDK
ncbi:hypothetical protein EB821_02490 [Candidatus Marinimicrobia bacterium PRS2]|nr:hypothetical protein EB821_02490 [Candidatus Marinimicrobia bacterium PRS2]